MFESNLSFVFVCEFEFWFLVTFLSRPVGRNFRFASVADLQPAARAQFIYVFINGLVSWYVSISQESSDGIVPYSSGHFPAAASELVLPNHHDAFDHPPGIDEIRRILHLPNGQEK